MHQYVVERIAVLANLHDLQSEALLYESELIVLAEHQFLAVTDVDGVLLAALLIIYGLVGAIIEDDAVLQNLADGSTLVLVGSLQDVNGALGIGGNGAGEEMAAGSEAQLGRTERVLHSTVGARLGNEAAG